MKRLAVIVGLVVLTVMSATAAQDVAPNASPPADVEMQLFLLIGQSNMAGRGKIEAEDLVVHPRVWKFTEDDRWAPGIDPLHFDKPKVAGVGLGTQFGKVIADAKPDMHIGLIPCAVGGTSIARWLPGKDLFEQAVRRAKAAQADGKIAGILWHQGESDCRPEKIAAHADHLEEVVQGFRDALGVPDAPFILGQLGHFRDAKAPHNATMNEVLTRFPATHPNTACASSDGLTHSGDLTHFNAASLREFGKRYAAAYLSLESARACDHPGDHPVSQPSATTPDP